MLLLLMLLLLKVLSLSLLVLLYLVLLILLQQVLLYQVLLLPLLLKTLLLLAYLLFLLALLYVVLLFLVLRYLLLIKSSLLIVVLLLPRHLLENGRGISEEVCCTYRHVDMVQIHFARGVGISVDNPFCVALVHEMINLVISDTARVGVCLVDCLLIALWSAPRLGAYYSLA